MSTEIIEKIEIILAEIQKSVVERVATSGDKYAHLKYAIRIGNAVDRLNREFSAAYPNGYNIKFLLRQLAELAIEAEVTL